MTTVSVFTPDGKRILRIGGLSYLDGAWLPVQGALAAQFEVPMDAVDTFEADDGTEWVTVDGRVIGYLTTQIAGLTFGVPGNDEPDTALDAVRGAMAAE